MNIHSNDNDRVERRAVSIVEDFFDNIVRLKNEIKKSDKGVCIDGKVFLENGEYIDVQVKGTESEKCKFQIEKKYFDYAANNFLCFFYVTNVFESPVLYYEVMNADKMMLRGGAKSKQYKFFRILNENSIDEFQSYVINKSKEFKYNHSFDISDKKISIVNADNAKEFFDYITAFHNVEMKVSFKPSEKKYSLINVVTDKKEKFFIDSNVNVGIEPVSETLSIVHNDKAYYFKKKIHLDGSIETNFHGISLHFKYHEEESYNVSIDYKAFRDKFNYDSLKVINEIVVYLRDVVGLEKFQLLELLESSLKVINRFNDFHFPKMFEQKFDFKTFEFIVKLETGQIPANEHQEIQVIKISDTTDYIMVINNKISGKRVLHYGGTNIFKIKGLICDDEVVGNELLLFLMFALPPTFMSCINLDYVKIYNDQMQTLTPYLNKNLLTNLFLNYLNNYIWNNTPEIRDILTDILYTIEDSSIEWRINKIQLIIHTEGDISEDDNLFLIGTRNTSNDNLVKLCCSILIGSVREANLYYGRIDDVQKKEFDNWPINTIYKDLKKV